LAFDRPLTFAQVRFRLQALGFRGISQTGNHAKFICDQDGQVKTAVLPHYTELSVSVVASILRQAGISEDEFLRAG
jgi:predicted RNA binding protein YcfA (HicA-like mRNA interferase family)